MAKSARKPSLVEVLAVLESQFGAPASTGVDEDPLLDHLLVAVLAPHTTEAKARQAVRAASEAFLDFNDLRVSPLAQIEAVIEPFVTAERRRQAAYDLRMALQDVYDSTHGLDLEPLRDRTPEAQRKFCKHLPAIHGGAAALIYQIALGDGTLAFGPGEEHLLTRFGLLPRAANRARQRAALERQIKPAERRRFAWLAGAGAHLYERDFDPAHPFCQLLVRAKAKELVIREQERKREEARRKAEEKKRLQDEERARKAAERERVRREREEVRRQRDAERDRKKAEVVAARRAKEQAHKDAVAARQKAAQEARALARKQAQERKAAERKKAAEKRAAEKKANEKKVAEQKAADKKAADKKAAEQKAADRKAAEAKAPARKAAAKKPASRAAKRPAQRAPAGRRHR